MKKTLFLFLFPVMIKLCYSQENSIFQFNDTIIYSVVDELPSFPGGDSVLADFIKKNFKYTENAKEQGTIARTTRVSFIVTSAGKIKSVKLVEPNKNTSSFDNEVAGVLEKMSDWNPGKINAVPVNVKYLLDIYIDTQFKSIGTYYFNQARTTFGNFTGERRVIINDLTRYSFMKTKADDAYNIGVAKSNEGDFVWAINAFSETLSYFPYDVDALYNRGIIKFKTNDREGACLDWNVIKKMGRNDADELLKKYCNVPMVNKGQQEAFCNLDSMKEIDGRKVYDIVEQMPVFPGGEKAFYEFLRNEYKYPKNQKKNGWVAYASFIVDDNGNIRNLCIMKRKDSNGELEPVEIEALRVLSKMPQWIPGREKGIAVPVRCNAPINFMK